MLRKIAKKIAAWKVGMVLLIVGGTSAPARAGGSSWEVAIESLEIESSTEAIATFKVLKPQESWYPHCSRMTVAIAYVPERKGEQTWSKSIVTHSTHRNAITVLDRAHRRRETLHFGTVASGLGIEKARSPLNSWFQRLMQRFSLAQPDKLQSITAPTAKPDCRFKARGLSLEEEDNGKPQVYAFYGKL